MPVFIFEITVSMGNRAINIYLYLDTQMGPNDAPRNYIDTITIVYKIWVSYYVSDKIVNIWNGPVSLEDIYFGWEPRALLRVPKICAEKLTKIKYKIFYRYFEK